MAEGQHQSTPWMISFAGSSWRFTIYTIHFFICISHQSLNIFHRSKTGGSPNEQTLPIIRSDPTMAGEINLGAKNSSSEAFDTFSFLKVSEVCCGF